MVVGGEMCTTSSTSQSRGVGRFAGLSTKHSRAAPRRDGGKHSIELIRGSLASQTQSSSLSGAPASSTVSFFYRVPFFITLPFRPRQRDRSSAGPKASASSLESENEETVKEGTGRGGAARLGRSYFFEVDCPCLSTIRSFSTPNEPGTSRALMPASVLSLSLSTTPSSVTLRLFTMM